MRWLGGKRLRFLRGQKGFTLIESLVAVGILAVIGVAFGSGLSTVSKSSAFYEQRVTATLLAQSLLENIKQAPFNPDATNDPHYSEDVSWPTDVPHPYEISLDVIEDVTGKQLITVTVTWDGRHMFDLTTIKGDW